MTWDHSKRRYISNLRRSGRAAVNFLSSMAETLILSKAWVRSALILNICADARSVSMLNSVAIVWGENSNPSPPAEPPGISFSLWSAVLRKPWLKWRLGEMPDLSEYKFFLINLFQTEDSTHAEQIRARFPDAYIIISPDPSLDLVLMHTDWMNMNRHMQFSDLIPSRTHAQCHFSDNML